MYDEKYIGITIGPIYDTISKTSSPAGLWLASYMFSYISHRLCKLIVSKELVINETQIMTPFYSEKESLLNKQDGVGLFHDRIIFRPNSEFMTMEKALEKVKRLLDEVTIEIADLFYESEREREKTREWFSQYLQLHAVVFQKKEEDNLIESSIIPLNAIELEKSFPTVQIPDPMNAMFESLEKNHLIRNIRDSMGIKKWPISKNNESHNFPTIEEIIGLENDNKNENNISLKAKSYYAIIQADGDNMTSLLKQGKDVHAFSKDCLKFCSMAAKEVIENYGGMTIYAGGDDLLMITPVILADGSENILNLLCSINKVFNKIFNKEIASNEGVPTISFGVSIRYRKYPLYEAFNETYDMLLRAKEKKNAAAISLQKHSGTAIEFVIEDFKDSKITEKLLEMIKHHADEEILKSIPQKIGQFRSLFSFAIERDKEVIDNIFSNIFDEEIHKKFKGELDATEFLLNLICEKHKKNGQDSEDKILSFIVALLRFIGFFSERGIGGELP